MKNLVTIKALEKEKIDEIISLAKKFEKGEINSSCVNQNLSLMFFEASTRTRFSFEMAGNKLGINLYQFDTQNSSLVKDESFFDTIENLYAIGIRACVIRNRERIIEDLINKNTKMRFINAGEGNFAHPTQALLDYYTMKDLMGSIKDKKVVIIGDIAHSRVAKSNIELLQKQGADITLVAPNYFKDDSIKLNWSENLDEELRNADITMCLRIQKERIEEKIPFDDYIKNFQVNEKNINPKSLLMHPGPVNRNIEISSNLLNSNQAKTILTQAKNGVFVRQAVLNMILGGLNE